MTFLRGRSVALACVMVAGAAALVAPSAAMAKKAKGSVCTGVSVDGQGAAVATNAETKWTTEFSSNANTNPFACKSGTPTVTYETTSSGKGLDSWGAGGSLVSDPPGNAGFGTNNAFLLTEEPPTTSETSDIESFESSPASPSATVLSIPVAQEAIAVLVNLPTGCTAASTDYPAPNGRLVLDNVTLEAIFNGTIKNWSQITENGDTVSGGSCTNTTEITRVVRPDSAGTTHILKQYLNLINDNPLSTSEGPQTWAALSDGTLNTIWPNAAGTTPLASSSSTGDNAEIKKVEETPSSIGYGSLTDARGNAKFVPPPTGTGGPGTATFWVPIQNNGVVTGKKAQTYQDPAFNGEADAKSSANCALTKYTNGKGTKFPPTSVADDWEEVTTNTKEKAYPICGLVYTVALGDYGAFPSTGTGSTEWQTVQDYLNYDLSTAADGGQTFLNTLDYEELPSKLVKESVAGLALIQ
jgi:ABC-type phosphate transport system substrate-binding protein